MSQNDSGTINLPPEVSALAITFEDISDPILIIDSDSRIVYANPSCQEFLGYTLAELESQPLNTFIVVDKSDFHKFTQSKKWVGEASAIHKAHHNIQAQLGLTPLEARGYRMAIVKAKTPDTAIQSESDEREVLAEIGRTMASSLHIEDVYERFVTLVRKLLQFDRITFNLIDMDNESFTDAYVMGFDVPDRRQGSITSLFGSGTKVAVETREVFVLHPSNRQLLSSEFPAVMPAYDEGLRSFMFAPLISRNEILGCLHIASTTPNAYHERDVRVIDRISGQIASAIANALLFDERMRAEKELRESREHVRLLVENAGDSLFVHEINGKILDTNQSACEVLGYSRHEILSMAIQDVEVVSEDDTYLMKTDEPDAGFPITLERVYKKKDGSTLPVEVRLGSFESEGRILMLSLARDITRRKQLEDQLRQSQKMEAIGQLAGGIAHDFNNLLSAITSFTQLALIKVPPNERLHSYLEEVVKASERAAGLTKQLLLFSRKQPVEPQVIDINNLIRDMDNLLRPLISENIELDMKLSPEPCLVKADRGQMEQVMMNLMVNAVDAMPNGGLLTIRTGISISTSVAEDLYAQESDSIQQKFVTLQVQDTGVGMSADVKEHIFEPFFTTKMPGKGTGLGLSTCYGIVAQNGGSITVDSAPGKGTSFNVHLPQVEDASHSENIATERTPMPVGTETILLVEDEEMVRDVASQVLKQQGYVILEAANGAEALAIAEEYRGYKIHLLLTDVIMPVMSGVELAQRFKLVFPDAKVLFTSGYPEDAISQEEILTSGIQFLPKPFTPSLLSEKIRQTLDN